MPFSQSYAFMTQMSSVWPIDTSVTDFSAVYKGGTVVPNGGWYLLSTVYVVISAGRAVSILTCLELSLSLAEFTRVRGRLLGRGDGRSKRLSKTAI